MRLRPVVLKGESGANAFVRRHHRHSAPVTGCRFAVGVECGEGVLRGVAICGRPVARGLDDGWTAEVLRVCTDGTPNACSMLYSACRRALRAMGYTRVITYTLAGEGGASLRAAGARPVGEVKGREWDTPARRRRPGHHIEDRVRWEL